MKIKLTIVIWVIIINCLSIYSQVEKLNHTQYLNNLQLELGGHGLLYSLNYERFFNHHQAFKTSVQFGISYYPPKHGIRDFWFPISINEIFSVNKHHLEVGLGYIPIRESLRDSDLNVEKWFWSSVFSARMGYRFQPPNKKLFFRAGFTPFLEIISRDSNSGNNNYLYEFHASGGLAIGYCF